MKSKRKPQGLGEIQMNTAENLKIQGKCKWNPAEILNI
jgi:hypothetical protein